MCLLCSRGSLESLTLSCLEGAELPRPSEVSPRPEPDGGRWNAGPPAVGSVCCGHADAAAVHRGDPSQDAALPDQTQAGLHAHRHRHQVDAAEAVSHSKHVCSNLNVISVRRGKIVLGYNELEISMKGSGYKFIHAADMMFCADIHIRSESESLHAQSAKRLRANR